MYENKLSNYKHAYGRFPSHLNLVKLWHYQQIEKKKDFDPIYVKLNHILRHIKSLGIETPPFHDPKPKKFHPCKKLKHIHWRH
jgi:hypothetical protein